VDAPQVDVGGHRIFTPLPRDEVKADLSMAGANNIAVICKEDIEQFLDRIPFSDDADAVFSKIRTLIILLAVLVVLLTSKEKSQSATASDSQEMLQRRLALAETNLQQSLQLAASLNTKANDARWKQQMTLLSTRKELQDSIQQIHDTVLQSSQELDAANAADPAERLKFLNAELATAQTRKLEVQNSLAAAEENINRLKQRVADMGKQVTAKLDELQCRNSDLSRNETDINWTSTLDNEIAEPIQGKGLDPNAVASYFSGLSSDEVYVVFCVYEDSFPAFIRAKQSTVASGVAYGWEPFRDQDGPVSFGENGHIPKAQ
jgi:hypothetical protein